MMFTMRASIVGTTNACVTDSRRAVAIQSSGEKRTPGNGTTLRPLYVELSIAVTPAMWKGGDDMSEASSSPAEPNSTVLKTYASSWSCSRSAALGAADVPLVNRRTAGRSGDSGNARSDPLLASTQFEPAVIDGSIRAISSWSDPSGSR